MNRVRQGRKTGAVLGLFALVLQLWLSFGHVHAASAAATHTENTALSEPDDHGGEPTLHRELCAICVTGQLLASSSVPPAPVLTHRPAVTAVDHTPLAGRSTPGEAPRRFLARAPPVA